MAVQNPYSYWQLVALEGPVQVMQSIHSDHTRLITEDNKKKKRPNIQISRRI